MSARPPFSALLVLAALLCRALSAHLPAVRRGPAPQPVDSKRVLASRLIRSADRHKERSLRDVLGETDLPRASGVRRDDARRRARAEDSARDASLRREPGPSAERVRVQGERDAEQGERGAEYPHGEDGSLKIRTMSQLFAWAINNTVYGTANYSSRLLAPTEGDERPVGEAVNVDLEAEEELPGEQWVGADEEERDVLREAARVSGRKALPPGDPRKARKSVRNARRKKKGAAGSAGAGKGAANGADFELLSSATESEFDIIRRNVHVLDKEGLSPEKTVNALLVLEELCHSIDNGRDLQISGGISPLLKALSSRHDTVRASAAWALATCAQNNPPVQTASLSLNAVPMLSRLAAHDASSTVRSKALFALNAMLELESARVAFEELPFAIHVVRNALLDSSNFRATRRALNLTELLVQRNLDAWKTQLEAWDIPVLIERLMRSHPDIDVRESAARTIAALDGRPVA